MFPSGACHLLISTLVLMAGCGVLDQSTESAGGNPSRHVFIPHPVSRVPKEPSVFGTLSCVIFTASRAQSGWLNFLTVVTVTLMGAVDFVFAFHASAWGPVSSPLAVPFLIAVLRNVFAISAWAVVHSTSIRAPAITRPGARFDFMVVCIGAPFEYCVYFTRTHNNTTVRQMDADRILSACRSAECTRWKRSGLPSGHRIEKCVRAIAGICAFDSATRSLQG